MDKVSHSFEYRKLPVLFCILTFSGVWCPDDWTASSKITYRFYTLIQVIAGVIFWFAILINIIVTGTHSEHIYENLFALSTLSYAIYKDYFVLKNRKLIVSFLRLCLEDDWYTPQDDFERTIVENYSYETRFA